MKSFFRLFAGVFERYYKLGLKCAAYSAFEGNGVMAVMAEGRGGVFVRNYFRAAAFAYVKIGMLAEIVFALRVYFFVVTFVGRVYLRLGERGIAEIADKFLSVSLEFDCSSAIRTFKL